jgi:hypothetical protein
VKTLLISLLLLGSLQPLTAQSKRNSTPTLYFILSDSSVVSGRLVREDSSVVVVRKRNGDLTYLEPYQIVRREVTLPRESTRPGEGMLAFSLKDGSTVYGQIVRQTPLAVVVRQLNGTQTYIDPGDILSRTSIAPPPDTTITIPGRLQVDLPLAIPYLLNARTAYMPRGGEVFYRNTNVIRNELEFGITNGWSVGVIANPLLTRLFLTSELVSDAIYTNTDFGTQVYSRVGIPIGAKLRIGAGVMAQIQSPDFILSTQTTWLGQVLTSFGDARSHVTLGYTFPVGDNRGGLLTENALTVGTIQYLSPSLSFISDNAIKVKSSYGPVARLSGALRIKSRRHAFDLGVLTSLNTLYSFNYNQIRYRAYPYVGYVVGF